LDIKNPKKEGFLGFWGRFPSFFHFPPFFPLLAIENEKQPINPSTLHLLIIIIIIIIK
jgi:hypothetical protein